MDDVGLTPGEPDTPAEPVEAVELVDTGEAAVVAVDRRLSRRQQSTLLGGMPSTRRAAGGLIVAVGASTVFIAVYWVPGHTAQYAVPGRPALLTVLLSFAVSVANFFVYGRRSALLPGWRTTVPLAVMLIVLSALEMVWAVRYARRAAGAGYPDAVGSVTFIGAVLVITGSLLAVGGRRARARRVPARAWFVGAAVALGTLIAALVIGSSANGWTVHRSPGPGGTPPGVPEVVSTVAWTRDLPNAGVAAGGPGLIVATGDTLRGLAAADGHEVWSYRRRGAQIDRIVTSPDGATLYVDLAELDPDGNGTLVVDAMTGRARFATNRRIDAGGVNVADAGVVDAGTDAAGALRVVMRPGTVDGRSWEWARTDCSNPSPAQMAVTADRVVIAERCGNVPWTLIALDAGSGAQVWSARAPGFGESLRVAAGSETGVVTLVDTTDEIPATFRRLADGEPFRVPRQGYESFGYLVATDARNVAAGVVDPRHADTVLPLSPGLAPVVDRAGAVLTLGTQIVTAPAVSASLRAVDVALVSLPSGRGTTVHTGLDPGDEVHLVSGPGAAFVVVRSGNGDVGVAALT